jgi:hypothetical protein
MSMRALGAAVLIALCTAGIAQAKGPDLARACGASGCHTVRGAPRVYELIEWTYGMFTVADAPRPAPFYRIVLRDRGRVSWTLLYVPSKRLVRVWQPAINSLYAPGGGSPYWRPVNAKGAAVLGRTLAGLKPFSAPRTWR